MGNRSDPEIERAALERTTRLTRTIVRVLAVATALVVSLSFLDERNDIRVTLAIHGTDAVLLAVAWWSIERGRARVAAWLISFMFWAVVAASAWLFGGLEYELSAAYIVSIMIAGATLGGRAATLFTVLSIGMSTVVLSAHLGGWLPQPITPPSIINAWISVTVSLLLAAYLLHVALRSLEDALLRVRANEVERDRAQQRYLQAQKMEPVGRLAAGVAHDFNNLLSAMTTIGGVLRRRVGDQARIAPLLDDLDAATDRAAMMTRQLLAFSRARAPAFEVFELDALLGRSIPLLARMLGDDVRIDLRLEAPAVNVRADRSQLEQVFMNLAVNARDAMPDGGTLRIDTRHLEGGRIAIQVADTGTGIDPAALPHLFEPFFTTKSTGTGLGLATVRDIVEATGGTIVVESEPDRGTRFSLEFPVHDGPLDATPIEHVPTDLPLVSGLRVLLVEDHELVRRATRQALEDAGFDVTAVNDGSEALALVDGGSSFDALVTDLRMPRVSGEVLAATLVDRGHGVPIVFMSGHEERLPESLDGLPVPRRFLAKPVTPESLVQAVSEVVREKNERGRDPSGHTG